MLKIINFQESVSYSSDPGKFVLKFLENKPGIPIFQNIPEFALK